MPILHIRVSEPLNEKIRAAAEADRRSVSNWVARTVERALEGAVREDGRDGNN